MDIIFVMWCEYVNINVGIVRKRSINTFFVLLRLVHLEISRTPHPWEGQVVICIRQYIYLGLPKRWTCLTRCVHHCVWVCVCVEGEFGTWVFFQVWNMSHPNDKRTAESEECHPSHARTHAPRSPHSFSRTDKQTHHTYWEWGWRTTKKVFPASYDFRATVTYSTQCACLCWRSGDACEMCF